MKRFTKQENSWVVYDWANSAYSIVVTTAVFPLFYKSAAAEGGVSAAQSTAYLGYTIAISTFILAMLGPILGTIADYEGCKKSSSVSLCQPVSPAPRRLPLFQVNIGFFCCCSTPYRLSVFPAPMYSTTPSSLTSRLRNG